MPAITVVSYVRPTDGSEPKFDTEYYLKTHMPLVQQSFAPYGLQEWETIQQGEKSPYHYVAILRFDEVANLRRAVADKGQEVFGDIPNFTNMTYVTSAGDQTAHWKA